MSSWLYCFLCKKPSVCSFLKGKQFHLQGSLSDILAPVCFQKL